MIYIENKHLYFKNIPKLSGHCPIFAGVIAKENIKKTDRCTTCALRKFLQRNHHEAEIFLTKKKSYLNRSIFKINIGE